MLSNKETRTAALNLLGRLMDEREKLHLLFDEARETFASTRAMWETLEQQDFGEVLAVTGCATVEDVKRRKVEDIGAAEANLKSIQEMESVNGANIDKVWQMLKVLNA